MGEYFVLSIGSPTLEAGVRSGSSISGMGINSVLHDAISAY